MTRLGGGGKQNILKEKAFWLEEDIHMRLSVKDFSPLERPVGDFLLLRGVPRGAALHRKKSSIVLNSA
jgi:hypothetical protein